MRLARVVRAAPVASESADGRPGMIVVEALRSGARIAIERGADQATLAMVLDLLGCGVGAQP
ncbi:MAG: hypothetical protein NT062_36660 [Proteobacteria bacterium]|nr:hypothetical protein [Pseudomonadota bacterium]